MRKLASIQTVEAIDSIAGADRIEKATVMGWSVVVKRGDFRPGDRCIFFEIDSVLPEQPWCEFMRERKFRVKTARLRGVLSQGLVMPVDLLGPGDHGVGDHEVGDDVTERLGVRKYEPPEPVGPKIAGPFIPSVPKTDEIRIQSALHMLDELHNLPYYVTEKVDGTSCTVACIDGELYVCSRNHRVRMTGHFGNVVQRYELDTRLPEGLAFQGEVCGPGIQKNRLALPKHDIRVFDCFDIRNGTYVSWPRMSEECRAVGLRVVNCIEVGDSFDYQLDQLLDMAKGVYAGTPNRREGIVVRPQHPMRSDTLGGARLSFKVLNDEFLLKDEA